MRRRIRGTAVWFACAGALLAADGAHAQVSPRQERNFEGTLINQDYFTAGLYPEVKRILAQVERFHFGERVWKNFRDGLYKEAKDDCLYILKYFPNHPQVLHLLSEVGIATNEPGFAIPLFEEALREYPHPYTHAQYGQFLIKIGATSAGVLELREALRMDPELFIARAWLSDAVGADAAEEPARRLPSNP